MPNIEIKNPKVDLDFANTHSLISPETKEGKEFDEYMRGIMDKLFANNMEQKALIDKFEFSFYLKDDPAESSPARISLAEPKISPTDLRGDKFAVFFSKDQLKNISSENELAFILVHELSHSLWVNGCEGVHKLHNNEEVACDLNAMKLMNKAGYSVREVVEMKKRDCEKFKTHEMVLRKDECEKLSSSLWNFNPAKPFDASKYQDVSFVQWKHAFDVPAVDENEEVAVEKMVKNLNKVYQKGGQDGFKEMMKDYAQSVGSEKASKLFLNLTAKVTEEFPPIDKVKAEEDYLKQFKHPISVLGEAAHPIEKMSGKKLYPPQARAKISTYMKDNPNYFKNMDFVWDKWVNPAAPKATKTRED